MTTDQTRDGACHPGISLTRCMTWATAGLKMCSKLLTTGKSCRIHPEPRPKHSNQGPEDRLRGTPNSETSRLAASSVCFLQVSSVIVIVLINNLPCAVKTAGSKLKIYQAVVIEAYHSSRLTMDFPNIRTQAGCTIHTDLSSLQSLAL
jgi:hypothetical protein